MNSWHIKNIIVILLVIFGLILVIHGHIELNDTNQESNSAQTSAKYEQNYDSKKHSDVEKSLVKNAIHSKDPKIRSIATNKDIYKKTSGPLLYFFSNYYDFANHQQYIQRPYQLRNVANNKVLHNKKYFSSDKDWSGNSVINTEQISSSFAGINSYITGQSKNNIYLLVDTQYRGKQQGTKSRLGEAWFLVTFNIKYNKITKLSEIWYVPNVYDIDAN